LINLIFLITLFYINIRILVLIDTVRSQSLGHLKNYSITSWIFFLGIVSSFLLLCTLIKWYYVILILIISGLDPILLINPKLYFSLKQKIMNFIVRNYTSVVVYFIVLNLSTIFTLINNLGYFK
jgi:hypothetical protein